VLGLPPGDARGPTGSLTMEGRLFHQDHTIPSGTNWIFVFGSNLQGRHGRGAAKVARLNFGAEHGVASGRTGHAYAIPTKAAPTMKPDDVLPIEQIRSSVEDFLAYARERQALFFFVTRVGCGLSGIPDAKVAPMFASAPANCSLALPWREFLGG
jgi:hypothetical protein